MKRIDFEERAAIIEDGAGVPRAWAEGYARLSLTKHPLGFTEKQWRQTINDGGRFLDRWAVKADRLGWSPEDAFGGRHLNPKWDRFGLVGLINGGDVVMMIRDAAKIRLESGSSVIYPRRR